MSTALAWLRRLLHPFSALLTGDEPAIITAAVAAGLNLAAHYGFHLNARTQTYFAIAVTALVHWVVRQSVTPLSKQTPPAPAADQTAAHRKSASRQAGVGLVELLIIGVLILLILALIGALR